MAQAIKIAFRYLYKLRGMATALESAGYITANDAEANYGPAAASSELSVTGSAPLNVQGLLGQLAQPQIAGAPSETSLPPLGSPEAQDGALVALNGAVYRFNGLTQPGSWQPLKAVGVVSFGLRSAMPAPGNSGVVYIQTDYHWGYLDNGTNFVYAFGTATGTDATRSGTTVGANDNGAVFITTDTKKVWYVAGGAWTLIGTLT